jgi:site-specific recombinase XerD
MLGKLAGIFLNELKIKGSSMNTVKSYSFHLDKFIGFIAEYGLDFRSLTVKQVRLFRNGMIEQGMKPKTVNAILSALRSFYSFLVEEGEAEGNPVIPGRLRVKEGRSLPDFMSNDELQIFLNWLKGVPKHVSLAYRTMLVTGLRVSEVAALIPGDLIALENGGYVLRVRHGKGDKERYAPVMAEDVAMELAQYKGDRRDDRPLFGITAQILHYWAARCRRETGLDFHTHRCRHTVATRLLQKGIPIDMVQEVMGHTDISTTRRYAKTAAEAVLELAAKVED